MPLSYTQITGTFDDGSGQALSGSVTFTPSETVYASGVPLATPDNPVSAQITGGLLKNSGGGTVQLLSTSNTGLTYEGRSGFFFWSVDISITSGGGTSADQWNFFLPSSPSPVDLYTLANSPASGGFTNPMTTLGDMIDGTAGGIAARLSGPAAGSAAYVLTSTPSGSAAQAPAWSLFLDAAASDFRPAGVAAAGSKGQAADAEHVHPVQPWQFWVGAPSGGDDTGHINMVIGSAVTYAKANNYYAEVIFEPGVYDLASNPSGGTSGDCNAIIPIDPVSDTGQKLILVLRGTRRQAALYHWLQTTPQLAGTTLNTSYAGGTTPTTGDEPSVIGGPTPANGYGEASGLFSNMLIVIDGIGVAVPQDPQVAGFDFRGIGEAAVVSASALARSAGTGAPARPDSGSGLWAWGLYMPQSNNNDLCDIGEYSCEGFPIGLWAEEHVSATSLRLINCYAGLYVSPQSGFPHTNWFGYISIENCYKCVVLASGATSKLIVGCLDIEWDAMSGGPIIQVAGGTNAFGEISVQANGNSGASLSAAMSSGINANTATGGLRVINSDMATGPWSSAPAVPGSGTAQLNTAWRDATVYLTSGGAAVTVIKVDSTATGLTLGTTGTVTLRVPSGHSVTPTYASSAPTWQWVLDLPKPGRRPFTLRFPCSSVLPVRG